MSLKQQFCLIVNIAAGDNLFEKKKCLQQKKVKEIMKIIRYEQHLTLICDYKYLMQIE